MREKSFVVRGNNGIEPAVIRDRQRSGHQDRRNGKGSPARAFGRQGQGIDSATATNRSSDTERRCNVINAVARHRAGNGMAERSRITIEDSRRTDRVIYRERMRSPDIRHIRPNGSLAVD